MSTWQNVFLENDMVTLKFSCGRSIIGFCGLGTGLGIPSARARKWPSQPDRGGCGLSFSRSQPSCRYQQDQPSHPPHISVITGYLITGHLVREKVATGRVDLPTFYARRARCLLPAASLTLVSVRVAAYMWIPAATWATTTSDIAASTMYAQNWVLVRRSMDYYAQDQAPSPLQHFWSLAVEEQFYLGWPVLAAGVAAWWRRRVGRDSKGARSTGSSSPASPLQSAPTRPRVRPGHGNSLQPVPRCIDVLCWCQPSSRLLYDAHPLVRARTGQPAGSLGCRAV